MPWIIFLPIVIGCSCSGITLSIHEIRSEVSANSAIYVLSAGMCSQKCSGLAPCYGLAPPSRYIGSIRLLSHQHKSNRMGWRGLEVFQNPNVRLSQICTQVFSRSFSALRLASLRLASRSVGVGSRLASPENRSNPPTLRPNFRTAFG